MKLVTEGAQAVLLNRLTCMSQKIDDLVLEVNALMVQREECCYPATHGITNDGSFITDDGEFLTVDLTIP